MGPTDSPPGTTRSDSGVFRSHFRISIPSISVTSESETDSPPVKDRELIEP